MLKHYVNDYNEEFVKNIFRQAKENNEKELVENMVKINPGLAINFMEATISHQQSSTHEIEETNFLGGIIYR